MSVLEAFINGHCDLADPFHRVRDVQAPDLCYDFDGSGRRDSLGGGCEILGEYLLLNK